MNSGIINLAPLYKYLVDHSYSTEILNGTTPIARGYSKKSKELCNNIATGPGLYLWGYYDNKKFWINRYVGQASGRGSTSTLYARILEELRDERLFLWEEEGNSKDAREFACNHYKNNQRKVSRHFDRALEKKGSTYILWCAIDQVLERKILGQIEADLIETLNPVGNKKRPTPNLGMHDIAVTAEIIAKFRDLIHSERNKKANSLHDGSTEIPDQIPLQARG